MPMDDRDGKMLQFKIKICLIVLFAINGYTRAGFIEMDSATMAKAYIDAYFDNIGEISHKHANESNKQFNSELCFEQLKYLRMQLEKGEMWAVKVIDSWGKIPSGILYGNIISIGNLDQCVEIRQSSNDTSIENFRGQYCLTEIGLSIEDGDPTIEKISNDFGMPIEKIKDVVHVGIGSCFPAVCSPEMLMDIMEPNLEKFHLKMTKPFDSNSCQTDEPTPIKTVDYFATGFFSVILFIMVLSTIVDVIYKKLDKKPSSILIMFSIYTNGKKLLNYQKSNSEDAIHCIDGIKAISIIWVIYSHEMLGYAAVPTVNAIKFLELFSSNTATVTMAATFAVDNFLLVTGFLISWLGLKHITKSKGRLNIPMLYFHRLIRVIPICFACGLFQLTIFKFLGDGPLWKMGTKVMIDHCENNLWSSISFIGNYYRADEPCPDINWYIAADMQLYFFAPFLLYLVWRFGKNISFIFPIGIAYAIGYAFYVANKYKLIIQNMILTHDLWNYVMFIHYVTHIRMAPWIIGFALGVIMHGLRDKKVKLSPIVVSIGWFIAISLIVGCFLESHRILSYKGFTDHYENALFIAFRNSVWSLGMSWIIFSSYYGYGGPINYILSMPFFRPISRITLSIYLTHNFVYIPGFAISRAPLYINQYLIFQRGMGDVVIACFVAAFASLAFESPVIQLEKILFGKGRNSFNPDVRSKSIDTIKMGKYSIRNGNV